MLAMSYIFVLKQFVFPLLEPILSFCHGRLYYVAETVRNNHYKISTLKRSDMRI